MLPLLPVVPCPAQQDVKIFTAPFYVHRRLAAITLTQNEALRIPSACTSSAGKLSYFILNTSKSPEDDVEVSSRDHLVNPHSKSFRSIMLGPWRLNSLSHRPVCNHLLAPLAQLGDTPVKRRRSLYAHIEFRVALQSARDFSRILTVCLALETLGHDIRSMRHNCRTNSRRVCLTQCEITSHYVDTVLFYASPPTGIRA